MPIVKKLSLVLPTDRALVRELRDICGRIAKVPISLCRREGPRLSFRLYLLDSDDQRLAPTKPLFFKSRFNIVRSGIGSTGLWSR